MRKCDIDKFIESDERVDDQLIKALKEMNIDEDLKNFKNDDLERFLNGDYDK